MTKISVLKLTLYRKTMSVTDYINSHLITHHDGRQATPEKLSRNELVMNNLTVVSQVMKRTVARLPQSVDVDDVWSAGVLGLIDAAQKFDGSREIRFRTYAETRIRGAMLDYLRSLSWAPRGLHKAEREIDRARQAVEQKTCREATVPELAHEMGLSIDDCHRLLDKLNRIDWCDSEEHTTSLKEIGGDDNAAIHLERRELLDIIWKAVDRLPERQRLVLWLYYGEEMTMKEVGAVLEVNEARASQLHSKAIQALRVEMSFCLGAPAGAGSKRRISTKKSAAKPAREPELRNQSRSRQKQVSA